MAQKFYAVKSGKKIGIYRSWDACKKQVHGYPGALYKSFLSLDEAENYMKGAEETKAEDDHFHHVYVDGSYLRFRYSWGFAVYLEGALIFTKNGVGQSEDAAKLHNVAGEIEAVIQAVEWAKTQNIEKIIIHHDYIGLSEWAEKRWKTNNDITAHYAAYMAENLHLVAFVKVAGHTGVAGNELADRLAKEALGIE